MIEREAEEIKKQSLKLAQELHKKAQEQGNADLYDKAAEYYFNAGKNKEANDCWDIAERLRNG